jgi:hypothetical protein
MRARLGGARERRAVSVLADVPRLSVLESLAWARRGEEGIDAQQWFR